MKQQTILDQVKFIDGDITKIQADAIVNAANISLLGGGGVDGAIHRAAGPKLLEECSSLKGCEPGMAKVTKGYDLLSQYVIHTVGPIWDNGRNKEQETLRSCYQSCLQIAKDKKLSTLAFPSVSTGLYGFPIQLAAPIALKVTAEFLSEHEFPETVIFVLYGPEDFGVYTQKWEELNHQGSESPVVLTEQEILSFSHECQHVAKGLKTREELVRIEGLLYQRFAEEFEKNIKKDKLMAQQSKMASMGEMIGMIAHQWRQPLSAITTAAAGLKIRLMKGTLDPEAIEYFASDINNQAQYLSTTINDFRNFFRPSNEPEQLYLGELVQKTLGIIGKSLEYNSVVVQVDIHLENQIHSFANELMQVFLNLLKNSKEALSDAKTPDPTITITGYQAEGGQVVEFRDNGPGIPEEIIESIFEPYFSTKGPGAGTGLGLYMSKVIIEQHCYGRLEAAQTQPGAMFRVWLPIGGSNG